MAFETFSGSSRGGARPKISIRKSESIGINTAAMEEFFEDEHTHAEVQYDSESNILRIIPKKEETDKSYKISRSASGGTIAPTSDLKAYNLIPEITTQYSPEKHKVNQNTYYVDVDLNDSIGTHGSRDEAEDDKPPKQEITQEDLDEEDVEIEEKAEQ